jgi:hypothetical protein
LVGREVVAARAGGEQTDLRFLDAVLGLAALTVNAGQEPLLFDGEVAVLVSGWFSRAAQAAQVCVG